MEFPKFNLPLREVIGDSVLDGPTDLRPGDLSINFLKIDGDRFGARELSADLDTGLSPSLLPVDIFLLGPS